MHRISVATNAFPVTELLPVAPEQKLPSRWTGANWVPLKWKHLTPTLSDTAKWAKWPECGVGVRGRIYPAIDVDIEDDDIVAKLKRTIARFLPVQSIRVRENSARILVPFHCPGLKKARLAGEWGAIELLGEGQFYVIAGIHSSGVEYKWNLFPDSDQMVPVSMDRVEALWADLRLTLDVLGLDTEQDTDPRKVEHEGATATTYSDAIHKMIKPKDGEQQRVKLSVFINALETIDPSNYSDWRDGLFALQTYFGDDSKLGLELADWWSRRAPEKYSDLATVTRQYHAGNPNPNGPSVTAWTMVGRAKEYQAKHKATTDEPLNPADLPDPPLRKQNGAWGMAVPNIANTDKVMEFYGLEGNKDLFSDKLYPTIRGEDVDVDLFMTTALQHMALCKVGSTEPERKRALKMWLSRHGTNLLTDWLDGCEAKEGHTIDALFETFKPRIISDPALAKQSLRRFFIAATAAAYGPTRAGHNRNRFEQSIILLGDQGLGKSDFIASLFPDWIRDRYIQLQAKLSYTSGSTNFKDTQLLISNHWVVEDAEHHQSARTADQRKAFLSTEFDTFRAPYAAEIVKRRRHCIVICSTNEFEMLNDLTGSRRYEIIEFEGEDALPVKHPVDIESLWAEAREAFFNGERWWMDRDTSKVYAKENERYTYISETEEALARTFDWDQKPSRHATDRKRNWCSTTDILTAIGEFPATLHPEVLKGLRQHAGRLLVHKFKAHRKRFADGVYYDMPPKRIHVTGPKHQEDTKVVHLAAHKTPRIDQ